MSKCSGPDSNTTWCFPHHSLQKYFVALLIVVGLLAVLRVLLYLLYATCSRVIQSRGQRNDRHVSSHDSRDDDYVDGDLSGGRHGQVQSSNPGSVSAGDLECVCVILAGEDCPTFIAQRAPLSGFKDLSKKLKGDGVELEQNAPGIMPSG